MDSDEKTEKCDLSSTVERIKTGNLETKKLIILSRMHEDITQVQEKWMVLPTFPSPDGCPSRGRCLPGPSSSCTHHVHHTRM